MIKLSKLFIYTNILAALSLISVCLFWQKSLFLVLVLFILSIITLAISRDREDIYLYILVFFAGALSESLAIYFGAWSYTLPDVIAIPFWLPFLWGNASLLIKRNSLEIHHLSKNLRS